VIYIIHLVPEADRKFIDPLLKLPAKDRLIPAAAIVTNAGILITGDKRHFAIYYGKQVHGVVIELPETFRERYPSPLRWD
jgi:hypothetical protein